jgi:hypothetical protein
MPPFVPSYGLQFGTKVLVVVLALAMLVFVLNLVRRKQLREQYSLLWIVGSVVLGLGAVFSDFVEAAAHAVGIFYPPAFLFLLAILLLFVLQFHFSTVVSSLRDQNKTLTQDLGLLEAELRELRRAHRDAPGPGKT